MARSSCGSCPGPPHGERFAPRAIAGYWNTTDAPVNIADGEKEALWVLMPPHSAMCRVPTVTLPAGALFVPPQCET